MPVLTKLPPPKSGLMLVSMAVWSSQVPELVSVTPAPLRNCPALPPAALVQVLVPPPLSTRVPVSTATTPLPAPLEVLLKPTPMVVTDAPLLV